jgi:hypothetical protein
MLGVQVGSRTMPPLTIPDPLDTNALYTAFRSKITELEQLELSDNERELLQLCRALFAFHFNEPV